MTDQPTTYADQSGVTLTLDAARGWGEPEHLSAGITCECKAHTQIHDLVMFVPTARLLAMIDAADPDAMRAYLRETAPEVIADLYRPEIPEADSPEDVDERPDVNQARAAGEQLGKIMRAFGDAYAEAMKR